MGLKNELVVASYNVHRCIGLDGNYDPDRTRRVLRELNADVVALQELERFQDDPGLLDFLTEDSPWRAIHGITMERESGQYGNALLTRLPVQDLWRQPLNFRRREPRGAIHALLQWGSQNVVVIATHFGLKPAERRQQARALVDACRGNSNGGHVAGWPRSAPVILLGDFNEWLFRRRSLRHLQAFFEPAPAPATWPSRRPVFALDRVFSSADTQVRSVEAVVTPLTRIASDHLPLKARFKHSSLRRS